MNQLDRFKEIITSYEKHGWRLQRVLMREETRGVMADSVEIDFDGIEPEITSVDAVWFARPSLEGREAWELRLVGDTPYALFEAFESDIDLELREEKIREIQLRLMEYVAGT